MDKQEFEYRVDQIKKLYARKDYKTIAAIADKIEWKKVKSASLSTIVAEAYDYNGEYLKAKEILELAYERGPITRNLLFRLSLSEVRVENIEAAIDFYKEFINTSPNDTNQYILQYEIAKASNVPVEDQIKILEEFTSIEMDEQWKCELARLYHEAGMDKKCVDICDEIILWFNDGEYVNKALELKKDHEPLSDSQQEKYDKIAVEEEKEPEIDNEENDIEDALEENEASYEKIDEQPIVGDLEENETVMAEKITESEKTEASAETDTEAEEVTEVEPETEEAEEVIEAESETEEAEEATEAESETEEAEEATEAESETEEAEEATEAEPEAEEAEEVIEAESETEEAVLQVAGLETEVKDITEILEAEPDTENAEDINNLGDTKELSEVPDYLLQVALASEMKDAVDKFGEETAEESFFGKSESKKTEPEYDDTAINELDNFFYMENEEGQMSLKMEELLQTDEQLEGQMSITDLLNAYEEKLSRDNAEAQLLAQQAAEKLLLVQNAREEAEKRVAEQRQKALEEAEKYAEVQNEDEEEENSEQLETEKAEDSNETLSSEINEIETQESEEEEPETAEDNQSFKLSDKQRELFNEHLISSNMETRICGTIEKLINRENEESPYAGANLIITGDVKCGKTTLIINIIKVANKTLQKKGRKIAKVKGRALNSKNIEQTLAKLENTDIVIENAGSLKSSKLEELIKAISKSNGERLFVLEDTKVTMAKMLRSHPIIKTLFRINLHVDELSVKQWACFAKEYAKSCGYEIEEMGMLALHVRIGEINKGETRLVTEDVKEIVDEAIENAKRKSIGKIFSAFSKKDKNTGVKLLREQDFI